MHRVTKIALRNNPVFDRPDHERHVAGEVPQMVFAPVAFLEFLEMHEGMVPGVEEETFAPALAGARLKLDGELRIPGTRKAQL